MATRFSEASPLATDPIEPFLTKTAAIRQDLDTKFAEYQQSLEERKLAISEELDRIEIEYKTGRREYSQKRSVLDQVKSNVKLQCETFKTMESTLLADVEKQIAILDKEYPEKELDLVLDTTFTEQIQRLGELELKILDKETPTIADAADFSSKPLPPVKIPEYSSGSKVKECKQPPRSPRDFTQMKEPILSAVKEGDGAGDLKYPQRVTIDPKTGNIFIADQTTHCVKIFSQQGEYKDAVRYNGNQLGYRFELVNPFVVYFFQDSLYVTSLLEKSFGALPQPCIFRFDLVNGSEAKFRYSMIVEVAGQMKVNSIDPELFVLTKLMETCMYATTRKGFKFLIKI